MFKNLLKQTLQFLLIIIIVSFAVDFFRGQAIDKKSVPHIQGVNLVNELVDINQLSQKEPVLVYFWGSWCPVCEFVSPSVDTLSQYYPVVTVAMNSGNNETIIKYLHANELSFEVINDEDGQISENLGVQVTPLVMVVDKGELVSYTTGYVSLFGLWWRTATADWL